MLSAAPRVLGGWEGVFTSCERAEFLFCVTGVGVGAWGGNLLFVCS